MKFTCYFGPFADQIAYRAVPVAEHTLDYPQLSAADITRIGTALRAERERLRALPLDRIIRAIDRAVPILLRFDELQLLPHLAGYSPAMVTHVLERMAADWQEAALRQLVVSEFGSEGPLDGWVEDRPGRRSHAAGAALTAHIFSGNVPGVAVTSLIRALIVKSPSFGKTARDEPVLPVLFARALEQVEPTLARALAIAYWEGGSIELDRALLSNAELSVVYGGAAAVDSLRALLPAGARLIVHGPRLSLGAIQASAIDDATVIRAAALAVATFDQQGCVSPHAIHVVGGSEFDARRFAVALAAELERLDALLPRGELSIAEAAALQRARAEAEFSSHAELVTAPAARATVVLDSSSDIRTSCLNRFLYVQTAADTRAWLASVARLGSIVQSVALAGFAQNETAELALQLGSFGVTRVTSFERLPWPPPDWHHDGSAPLRELVRFVDLED